MEADQITHRSQSEKDFMNALKLQDHRPALVLGCSSLKRVYRDILRNQAHPEEDEHPPRPLETIFVYLYGTFEVLSERMNHRTGHYMHQVRTIFVHIHAKSLTIPRTCSNHNLLTWRTPEIPKRMALSPSALTNSWPSKSTKPQRSSRITCSAEPLNLQFTYSDQSRLIFTEVDRLAHALLQPLLSRAPRHQLG